MQTMQKNWQPSATIDALHQRATLIKKVRTFFEERGFLEVETPILSRYTVTDPFLNSFSTLATTLTPALFLQTSPEYHMKRLLAANSGPIFQISKAFRQDEKGYRHNPEFTMLEWYRPGYNHHNLMDEMDDFLKIILNNQISERYSYEAIFKKYLDINPHTASLNELKACAKRHHIEFQDETANTDTWLDLLISHVIEPHLGQNHPVFIYDYPASQASLSVMRQDSGKSYQVGERFEVYYKGIELANGFHELTNFYEQKERFIDNLEKRKSLNLPTLSLDEYFLQALEAGLPATSGVALGLDRLIMLALEKKCIGEIMTFTIENA